MQTVSVKFHSPEPQLVEQALPFAPYAKLDDLQAQECIQAARSTLKNQAVLLCHHYQRADVYRHADITGDSLRLARLASQTNAQWIVFCGVHFMAEVADILSRPEQSAILPDLAAGCSMADMANLAKVQRCWRELGALLGDEADTCITPVTYINSAADLKAFCGDHGGIVCTSTNAPKILDWAFKQRSKVLFFPDQHLGRWTAWNKGIALDEMQIWDPDQKNGGLSAQQVQQAKILLWKGHCSVHQMFQPEQIHAWKERYPDGKVISHPECSFEVCRLSDYVGSTELIAQTIEAAPAATRWLVGTELNLVNRLAETMKPQGKIVQFMASTICMCSTMQRIDPQHLAWTLDNLCAGHVVNRIHVPAKEAQSAFIALERMLSIS